MTRTMVALILLTLCRGMAAVEQPWPFFSLDNGVGRDVWTAERQVATLSELGWDGISYRYTTAVDMAERAARCRAGSVRLVAMYFPVVVGVSELSADCTAAIRHLAGTGATLWITVEWAAHAKRTSVADSRILDAVRPVCRAAHTLDLPVSIYPHDGCAIASVQQALPVVRTLRAEGWDRLGVTLNLCHEQRAGRGDRIEETMREAGPLIDLVTINGADTGPEAKAIRLLGQGAFDVAGLLRSLAGIGYRGPVGCQFFGLPGDPRDNLRAAMQAWRAWSIHP